MRIPNRWALPAALVSALALGACNDDKSIAGPDQTVSYTQEDRFGLPAIATVFIPTAQKDAYNQASPSADRANFRQYVVSTLMAFGNSSAAANGLADAVMPDIQPLDLTANTQFLNGRKLTDDVITAELGLIFGANKALNDDHVDANDKPISGTFPYLAAPTLQ